MENWISFVVAFGTFLTLVAFSLRQNSQKSKDPPRKYPPPWPIGFLDIARAAINPQTNYYETCWKLGRTAPMNLWRWNWPKLSILLINDYDIAEELFKSPVFSARPENEVWRHHANGNYGMLTSTGKVWEEQRRKILKILKDTGVGSRSMESVIEREIDDFLKSLDDDKGTLISPNRRTPVPTLNALWTVFAGERFSHTDQTKHKMLLDIYDAFTMMTKIPHVFLLAFYQGPISMKTIQLFPTWLPFFNTFSVIVRRVDDLRTFCSRLLQKRQAKLLQQHPAQSFVDDYLKEIEMTTKEDSTFYKDTGMMNLLATIMDFFVAGGETTANGLAWSMLHLIRNPEVQQKLQAEIDAVVGRERRPTLADRPNLPWTEAFIWETLRLTPVTLFTMPHMTTEDVQVGPYFIEKHTTVILNIPAIQTDRRFWTDPEKFLPQRFISPDGKHFVKNSKMISFSIGKRKCPGMTFSLDNLFLFVSAICQNFTLKKDPTLKGFPPLAPELSIIGKPKKYFMVVEKR